MCLCPTKKSAANLAGERPAAQSAWAFCDRLEESGQPHPKASAAVDRHSGMKVRTVAD